jgi:RND superfamily putative drug exporter
MSSQPTDAKTARLSVPTNAAPGNQTATGPANSAPRPSASPTPPPPAPTPSSGQTRAIPVPTNPSGDDRNDPADPTAGLPTVRSDANVSEAATEKLKARGQSDHGDNGDNSRQRRRAGGGGAGVSAQELLRREGRL